MLLRMGLVHCTKDDNAVETLMKNLGFSTTTQCDLLPGVPIIYNGLVFRQKVQGKNYKCHRQASVIVQKLTNSPEQQLVRKGTQFTPML